MGKETDRPVSVEFLREGLTGVRVFSSKKPSALASVPPGLCAGRILFRDKPDARASGIFRRERKARAGSVAVVAFGWRARRPETEDRWRRRMSTPSPGLVRHLLSEINQQPRRARVPTRIYRWIRWPLVATIGACNGFRTPVRGYGQTGSASCVRPGRRIS